MGNSERMGQAIEFSVKREGWVCPLCGRALAPFMPFCPYHESQTETGDKADMAQTASRL